MGFNLICTFLFVIVLFMLVYNYDDNIKIIDTRENNEHFGSYDNMEDPEYTESGIINGSFEDLKIADINCPEGSDIYLDYSKCNDYAISPSILPPNDMLKSLIGKSYRDNVVYQDYSMTADETAAVTGILLQKDKSRAWRPIRTFEHDSKAL